MDVPKALIGTTLESDWLIEEHVDLDLNDSTGGFFCIPFKVRNTGTGEVGF